MICRTGAACSATSWKRGGQTPVQCHNGFLEILVNFRWVDLTFLGIVIVAGYWNTVRAVRVDSETNSVMPGLFVALLFYNTTEVPFKMMDPVWIFLVWGIAAASGADVGRRFVVRGIAPVEKISAAPDWYPLPEFRPGLCQEGD